MPQLNQYFIVLWNYSNTPVLVCSEWCYYYSEH